MSDSCLVIVLPKELLLSVLEPPLETVPEVFLFTELIVNDLLMDFNMASTCIIIWEAVKSYPELGFSNRSVFSIALCLITEQ